MSPVGRLFLFFLFSFFLLPGISYLSFSGHDPSPKTITC
jgi:hypothetical protein